jgi:PAS domain S-box-containing protein
MPRAGGDAIIEMKVSVVECGGTPAILGALTDITERRKTRLELQRVKERLESIIHSMNEVVVSFSPKDYSIRAINPAAEALYGVPLRDFTSGEKHILRFVHPNDREKVHSFYKDLPESEFSEIHYRIISNNNQVKWVLDEGHVVYSNEGIIRRIDHVIRDITEEKKATDALKQNEAKYRDFFESTTDMAFAITHEGVFLDINDAGLRLLGIESKEEALASNVKDFYVDLSEREKFVEEIYDRGHVEGRPVRFKNKSGDVIEVAITARVKNDDLGNFLYHEGIVHNISKALEDQRNRVLRNAAGSMCHYLNTHLMHLSSSQDGLSEEMESIEDLVQTLSLGEKPHEIAVGMKRSLNTMRYFSDSIRSAYEKVSEVTRVFNKAFHYKEEPYLIGTILDIFKAYGYEGDNPKK